MGKLTTRGVDALKEPGRYSDGDGSGFHLRIDAQGRKYWVLRVNDASGKRRDVSIGSAKRMTLSAARENARRVRDRIAQGDGAAVVTPTFREAARLAHEARTAGYRNDKHVAQWLSTLERHAFPAIGDKPVSDITRADAVQVLSPIWLATPETARRVLQRLDRVMRWAVGHNHRDERIDMSLVRDALPKQKGKRAAVRRMPAVPWREAPEFWRSIQMSTSAPQVRLALMLLMLTAVRPGNVRLAKRSQMDLEAGVWVIPAEEMKAGERHRVPLSAEAVTIVRSAMALHDHDQLFTVGGEPLSLDTLRMMMRRMGRSETPHGFRSTFKDWSLQAGWSDHLSEAALAHQDPNEVRAAYARSDLLEERAPMMAAWASYLATPPQTP